MEREAKEKKREKLNKRVKQRILSVEIKFEELINSISIIYV